MHTTKKTLILTSPRGVEGMASFTQLNGAVSFTVSVTSLSGSYRVKVTGDREYVFDAVSARSTFLLPPIELGYVGVEVFVNGKLFCRGGSETLGEVNNYEEHQDDSENESEEVEGEEERKEECITYFDDAVAEENYYPDSVKVVCINGKSRAVMLSKKLNDYIENLTDGLFDCKIKRDKPKEVADKTPAKKPDEAKRVLSGFAKKPFDYDEVASTVFPVESVGFSRKAYYFEEIKDKVDGIFKVGMREKELEKLMPDTVWVRLEYSPSAHYVVGLIGGKRNMPDYICYGVPSVYSPEPPKSLGQDARWVPVNVREPQGKGYWLLFQSAKSGETVRCE